jgi:molybdopterin-guanine dinucleotide biosynthesis protein A
MGATLGARRGARPARRSFKEVQFRQIRALVEGFDALRYQFGDRRRDAVRGLRVAAPAAVLGSVLRDAVAAYRRSHPTVRLTLTDVPSQAAWRMVERDEADLAIVGRPDGPSSAAVAHGHRSLTFVAQSRHLVRETVGIVLAGGRATRLGTLAAAAGGKAAVMLCGRTFLDAVLAALGPHVERIVVVAPHAAAAAATTAITPTPRVVETIHDTVPDGGPLAALADGLRHVTAARIGPSALRPGGAGAGSAAAAASMLDAVVVSCDVPLLKPAVVGLLLERLRTTAARWVVPEVLGHPQVLVSALDADLLPALEAHLAAGRRDVRGLLDGLAAADPGAVCRLDAAALAAVDPSLESFLDIDTPEDLAAIERRLAGCTGDGRR